MVNENKFFANHIFNPTFGEEHEENAEEVCLIAQKWWRSWCNYSKYPHSQIDTPDPDATKPGTIDNSELCSEDFALALDSSCQEDYDYV